jgi:hypothetical protein
MNYTFEMASYGTIYIPSFMKIGSGIHVPLRLLPRQPERLRCCYYCLEEIKFNGNWFRISRNIKGITPQRCLHLVVVVRLV